MQIFEQKSTTKMAYLYTLQNTIFQRTHARMRYCFIIRQLRRTRSDRSNKCEIRTKHQF